MSNYKHGIATERNASIATTPVTGAYNVQVVVGTAPVNLSEHALGEVVNRPVVISSKAEFIEYFGWSDDFDSYTLMKAAYMSFQKFAVAPIVMINVLDPENTKHTAAVTGTAAKIEGGLISLEDDGILADSIEVKYGSETAKADEDYAIGVTTDDRIALAVIPGGALEKVTDVTVNYKKLKPEGVTAEDIIGGLDENGIRTGIELIDEIYTQTSILPGILSAPGFSSDPKVAAALEAKAELAGDFSNAIAVVDIDSETTKKIGDVKEAKENLGAGSRWITACWPKVLAGGHVIEMSAAVSALLQSACVNNSDIPDSPDNMEILIDGLALADGKEINLTQAQVNDYLNAIGVVSCINLNGWKCWGNNTTAYPDNIEPNSRFIKNVMMANYLENRFKVDHLSKIGRTATIKKIESVVTEFNMLLNALTPDHLAGAEIVFNKADNPLTALQEGHLTFCTKYADYTPMEYILNKFTWDSTILEDALTGGDE